MELFAELETARMPRAAIAARLGIDPTTFEALTARLGAGRGYVEPATPSTAEILRERLWRSPTAL